MVAKTVSMAWRTSGASGRPGYPRDCERSDGPTKKTSTPGTCTISSTLLTASAFFELDADEGLAVSLFGVFGHRHAVSVASGPDTGGESAFAEGMVFDGFDGSAGVFGGVDMRHLDAHHARGP